MILSRDLINRYMRHIIIPEISGKGQKKLCETKILISAFDAKEANALVYYLAALGVGHIQCSFINKDGCDKLFDNIKDLNQDTTIELYEVNQASELSINVCNAIIILSYYERLDVVSREFIHINHIPIIVAIHKGWRGDLHIQTKQQDMNELISNDTTITKDENDAVGMILSSCFLGALAAIEYAKLSLEMGKPWDIPLYFDLFNIEFEHLQIKDCFEKMKVDNLEKHEAQLVVPYIETTTLHEKSVLIVGAGGLGSPAALALAAIGIGTIGIIDYDHVEISNLNRQILHASSRIGMQKVDSAKVFLNKEYPEVKIVTYNSYLNKNNATEIFESYDIILDCVDHFSARYLINDASYFQRKPLIDAAAVQFCGLILTVIPNQSACYRCIFPVKHESNKGLSCKESGVLGPVPGVMGFMQAAEAVKVLLKIGNLIKDKVIYYDALDTEFEILQIKKSSNCEICGANPKIKMLIEYETSCNLNQ